MAQVFQPYESTHFRFKINGLVFACEEIACLAKLYLTFWKVIQPWQLIPFVVPDLSSTTIPCKWSPPTPPSPPPLPLETCRLQWMGRYFLFWFWRSSISLGKFEGLFIQTSLSLTFYFSSVSWRVAQLRQQGQTLLSDSKGSLGFHFFSLVLSILRANSWPD